MRGGAAAVHIKQIYSILFKTNLQQANFTNKVHHFYVISTKTQFKEVCTRGGVVEVHIRPIYSILFTIDLQQASVTNKVQ